MYHLIDSTPETIDFIEKYLMEDQKIEKSHNDIGVVCRRWKELNYDFEKVDEIAITNYILTYYPSWDAERYQKYRGTYYWRIISEFKKLLAHQQCQMSDKHDKTSLNVHHGSYTIIHGRELRIIPQTNQQYMTMLVVLCGKCHKEHHDREKMKNSNITNQIPSNNIFNENPFESTKVMQEYLNYLIAKVEYNIFEKNKRLKL